MKKVFIILSLALITIGLSSCNGNSSRTETTAAAKPIGKYYCTMHPEITSEKAGTCSKCGMDLVERDTTTK